mgnify:FL=1
MAINKKKVALAAVKKVGTKIIRRAGPIAVAATLYDFYKSGQKNSGGKAVKGQKPFLANAKKKTKSLMTGRKKKKYI